MARTQKRIRLPIAGIQIVIGYGPDGKGGSVTSDLDHEAVDRQKLGVVEEQAAFDIYKDALYSLLLAHAVAGIDVASPAYLTGVQAIVDAMTNR